MATLPTPIAGRLLRWNQSGTALENVTVSDLLDQIASTTSPDASTNRYWIDTSAMFGAVLVSVPAAVAVLAASDPSVAGMKLVAVSPPAASAVASAGVPVFTKTVAGNVSVSAPAAAVPLTASTPSITRTASVAAPSASAAAVSAVPSVSTATMASVSAPAASAAATAYAPAFASAGGQAETALFTKDWSGVGGYPDYVGATVYAAGVIVRDPATDAIYESMQGGNQYKALNDMAWWRSYFPVEGEWTHINPAADTMRARLSQTYHGAFGPGALYSGAAANADQYAAIKIPASLSVNIIAQLWGPIVRGYIESGLIHGYGACLDRYDDGDTITYRRARIVRYGTGDVTPYFLASQIDYDITGLNYVRLDVSGTGATVTLTLKGKVNLADAWSTLITATDTAATRVVAAGAPGLRTGAATVLSTPWFSCGNL